MTAGVRGFGERFTLKRRLKPPLRLVFSLVQANETRGSHCGVEYSADQIAVHSEVRMEPKKDYYAVRVGEAAQPTSACFAVNLTRNPASDEKVSETGLALEDYVLPVQK